MWHRAANEYLQTHSELPKYRRELCGFNAERWQRAYGKANFGDGLKEIFSKP